MIKRIGLRTIRCNQINCTNDNGYGVFANRINYATSHACQRILQETWFQHRASNNKQEYTLIVTHISLNNILIEFRNLCLIFCLLSKLNAHVHVFILIFLTSFLPSFPFFFNSRYFVTERVWEWSKWKSVFFFWFVSPLEMARAFVFIEECILYSLHLIFVTYYFHFTRSARIINNCTRCEASERAGKWTNLHALKYGQSSTSSTTTLSALLAVCCCWWFI